MPMRRLMHCEKKILTAEWMPNGLSENCHPQSQSANKLSKTVEIVRTGDIATITVSDFVTNQIIVLAGSFGNRRISSQSGRKGGGSGCQAHMK